MKIKKVQLTIKEIVGRFKNKLDPTIRDINI